MYAVDQKNGWLFAVIGAGLLCLRLTQSGLAPGDVAHLGRTLIGRRFLVDETPSFASSLGLRLCLMKGNLTVAGRHGKAAAEAVCLL